MLPPALLCEDVKPHLVDTVIIGDGNISSSVWKTLFLLSRIIHVQGVHRIWLASNSL